MSRRKYSKDYKQKVVLLVQQSNISVSEVARNLGIYGNMLRQRIKEFSEPAKIAFTDQGNPRDEEVTGLKREWLRQKRNVIF